MTYKDVFQGVPVSKALWAHWEANAELASSAADTIWTLGGNPWVFSGDERHFEQFAGPEDRAAMRALSEAERDALLGPGFWMVLD